MPKLDSRQRRRLLLDILYGQRSQTEAAALAGVSTQRISQLVMDLEEDARRSNGWRRATPRMVSAYLYHRDQRVWPERDTPEYFYRHERFPS